ncbi:MAG: hypothetical protein Q8O67_24435 [Deltaproteobacteria bacterium]|nr:hypothetical protein [Deltaproteobacteria bacterium]
MKRVAVVVVVVCLIGAGVVLWAWRGLGLRTGAHAADEIDPAAARDRHRAAFLADLAAIEANPALQLRAGEDAGPWLNPRAPLVSQGQTLRPIAMPAALEKALDGRWLDYADDAGLVDVDSSLLVGLERFARWDHFANLPADVAPGTSLIDAPIPAWTHLRRLARLHLLKPLTAVEGDAPAATDFGSAARDVEALARLLSTSTLLGAVMGSSLFDDVVAAHELAEKRGKVGSHVVVVDAAMVARLRRALIAGPGYVIGAPAPDVDRVLGSQSLLLCSTVNEAGFHFELVRPFAADDDPTPAKLAAARTRVGSLCATQSRQPADVDTPLICQSDVNRVSCARQIKVLRAVLRGPSLRAMQAVAALDYFGRYESP